MQLEERNQKILAKKKKKELKDIVTVTSNRNTIHSKIKKKIANLQRTCWWRMHKKKSTTGCKIIMEYYIGTERTKCKGRIDE